MVALEIKIKSKLSIYSWMILKITVITIFQVNKYNFKGLIRFHHSWSI